MLGGGTTPKYLLSRKLCWHDQLLLLLVLLANIVEGIMAKKIKLQKGRRDWEPPPGEFDAYIPILVVLALYFALVPWLRSCS